MTVKHRLPLHANLEAVTGDRDELVFLVRGSRKTKSGVWHEYELELTTCRGAVTRLLREIKSMHVRDRARIAHELDRITRELRELTSGD